MASPWMMATKGRRANVSGKCLQRVIDVPIRRVDGLHGSTKIHRKRIYRIVVNAQRTVPTAIGALSVAFFQRAVFRFAHEKDVGSAVQNIVDPNAGIIVKDAVMEKGPSWSGGGGAKRRCPAPLASEIVRIAPIGMRDRVGGTLELWIRLELHCMIACRGLPPKRSKRFTKVVLIVAGLIFQEGQNQNGPRCAVVPARYTG